MNTTSIVLAGGRSSRLGKAKHNETIAGKSLIERTIDKLSPLSAEILIVISERQSKSAFSSYSPAKTVVDLYPEKGPLAGIYTGLVHSSNDRNLAVACDMPFLNTALLHYMIDISADFDVVIPRIGDYREPLHAVYSQSCLRPLEDLLNKDSLKISDLLDLVRVRYMEKDEIERFDPRHLSFFNINTSADLEKARMLASQETEGMIQRHSQARNTSEGQGK
ncbi:MAG: molybdenum cofactor guanylyltransferase [Dehalococcoidia bacterium]|nr:MAG: molybdenum cofactor guanylyltransferase [Dehalococcoidia bacterium]